MNIKKLKVNTLSKYFSYLVLFLLGMRFIDKNSTWVILLFLFQLTITIVHVRKIYILNEFLFLIFFEGIYFNFYNIYYPSMDYSTFIAIIAGAPMFYLVGYTLFDFDLNFEKTYWEVFIVISIGTFIFSILSYFIGGVQLDLLHDERYVIDIWTGTSLYCTNFNAYSVLACIGLYPIVKYSKSTTGKIIWVIMVLLSIIMSLATGSRTNLYMVAIMVMLGVLINIRKNFTFKRSICRKEIEKYLVGVVMLFFLICFWNHIIKMIPLTVMEERFNIRSSSISEDSRWVFWAETIDGLSKQPLGNIKNVKMAHNLFLDVGRVSGIIPMFFLAIYIFMILKTLWKIYRKPTISLKIKSLAILSTIGLFLSFMIEPVFEAKPYIFIFFALINGMNKRIKDSWNMAKPD